MTKKDRQRILEHMAKQFSQAHSDWVRLSNPSDLPYLAISFAKHILEDCWLFVGFYNWRREEFSATVGWLSQDWHPRTQELVERYPNRDGTLKQIRLRGSKDFGYLDFERGVGGLIPVSLGIAKSYDANTENFKQISDEMIADIEGPGFEYLDLMLQHRLGRRLAEVLSSGVTGR